jgi:hypothetical protein
MSSYPTYYTQNSLSCWRLFWQDVIIREAQINRVLIRFLFLYILQCFEVWWRREFFSSYPFTWELALILEHRADYSVSWFSQAVGLLGRVISSSQGLYLNTGQHKHRKTRTHIKHPCPGRDSNPQSRPPSDRRLFMPQTGRLPRLAEEEHSLQYMARSSKDLPLTVLTFRWNGLI